MERTRRWAHAHHSTGASTSGALVGSAAAGNGAVAATSSVRLGWPCHRQVAFRHKQHLPLLTIIGRYSPSHWGKPKWLSDISPRSVSQK